MSLRAFILSLFLFILPGFGYSQTVKEKLRVGLGSISFHSVVFPLGRDAGIFAKYGLDIEPIYIGGGMTVMATLTSGSVQFVSTGSTIPITARLGGADVMILAVQQNRFDYMVFATSEIKTAQDLKGKLVSGSRPGATADSALRLFLTRSGLVPDKDVIFMALPEGAPGRLNALRRGTISATVFSPPLSGIAAQLGFREIADMRKINIEYSGNSVAALESYIKAHPSTVEKLLKGFVETLYFMKTQKEKTITGLMKHLKLSDRSKAEEGYNYYVDEIPAMPYAHPTAMKTVLQFLADRLPKATTAAPQEFYDMSFLRKIDKSEFPKTLSQ